MPSRITPVTVLAATGLVLGWGAAKLSATPESLVLILDPTNAESMYIGNYYKHARGVPDANVVYMAPGAVDYPAFVDFNLPALASVVAERGLEGQADYVVIMPGASFYIDAPGLVSDSCSPVTRFSIASAYALAFQADETLSGTMGIGNSNRYAALNDQAERFDSELSYRQGIPSSLPDARRYYIGAMLGYTGTRGNTLNDITALIDRSVASDFTIPGGTFYYMETTDAARSDPRDGLFDSAVNSLAAIGFTGAHLQAIIPMGQHDCLGIMTGAATVDTAGDFTLLPGGIAEHLTSWAATFDKSAQTKVSAWIDAGASGSYGAVEEPCNYPGKFPHPRMHVFYARGMPLGAAMFRSLASTPYQGLVYGDPMTRAFDLPPVVSVAGLPVGDASGVLTLTPQVTIRNSGAFLTRTELTVDNRRLTTAPLNFAHTLDTTTLSDGWHDLRLLAFEISDSSSVGSFVQGVVVNNLGRSASVSADATTGSRTTRFTFTLGGAGPGTIVETRLLQNGRVVAAVPGASGQVSVFGQTLGAAASQVFAEALFSDGSRVKSPPLALDLAFAGPAPGSDAPVAFAAHVLTEGGAPRLLFFPHTTDAEPSSVALEIVSGPAQAALDLPGGPYALLTPNAGASGMDQIQFRVTTAGGTSNTATLTIVYDGFPPSCPADLSPPPDGDGAVNTNDFFQFLTFYQAMDSRADFSPPGGDGLINTNDFFAFLAAYQAGC